MLEVNSATFLLLAVILILGVLSIRRASHCPDVHPLILAQQATVSKTRRRGETAIYRSRQTPHGSPLDAGPMGIETLYDTFNAGLKMRDKNFLGHQPNGSGPFVWESYVEVNQRIKDFGSGLLTLSKLEPGKFSHNFLGIFMNNCPEWIIGDLAGAFYSLCTVPCYETSTAETIRHIIVKTSLTVIIVSRKTLSTIFEAKPDTPTLRLAILVESSVTPKEIETAKHLGITLMTFKEIAKKGQESPKEPVAPKGEDIATICWTSGTTELPKGAMLTHKNIVAMYYAVVRHVPPNAKLSANEVYMSYLPLSHCLEHAMCAAMLYLGGSIGLSSEEIRTVFDDASEIRPTLLPCVPHVLNRFYAKSMRMVGSAGGLKAKLFWMALKSKQKELKTGRLTNNTIWDRMAFPIIREKLGRRVRLVLCGSAVSPEVSEFSRILLGCQVVEGYGMTEASGGSTLTSLYAYKSTEGGPPLPCNEIKLVDVPEMNYTAEDQPNPRGEICLRGTNIFSGYFEDDEKTKEVLKEDGWFFTGDIGEWLPNGTLKRIGQKKALIKLSHGEYASAEKVEGILSQCAYIRQIFVHGDTPKFALVAIVVPDEETLVKWAQENQISARDMTGLCKNDRVLAMITNEIQMMGRNGKLNEFETPRAVYLSPEAFSVENGLLTPTLKLKRDIAKERFQMYWSTSHSINS